MQIQSHLGLHEIFPYVPTQAFSAPTPAGPAPVDSPDVLTAAIVATTPLAAPQPVEAEDDSSPATD